MTTDLCTEAAAGAGAPVPQLIFLAALALGFLCLYQCPTVSTANETRGVLSGRHVALRARRRHPGYICVLRS